MLDQMTNSELVDMIEELGYGEDTELEYYGRNFIIIDE